MDFQGPLFVGGAARVGLVYRAILCRLRKSSVSASESNERVLVRYGRPRVMYLSCQPSVLCPYGKKDRRRKRDIRFRHDCQCRHSFPFDKMIQDVSRHIRSSVE